jgi:hypothetical protein
MFQSFRDPYFEGKHTPALTTPFKPLYIGNSKLPLCSFCGSLQFETSADRCKYCAVGAWRIGCDTVLQPLVDHQAVIQVFKKKFDECDAVTQELDKMSKENQIAAASANSTQDNYKRALHALTDNMKSVLHGFRIKLLEHREYELAQVIDVVVDRLERMQTHFTNPFTLSELDKQSLTLEEMEYIQDYELSTCERNSKGFYKAPLEKVFPVIARQPKRMWHMYKRIWMDLQIETAYKKIQIKHQAKIKRDIQTFYDVMQASIDACYEEFHNMSTDKDLIHITETLHALGEESFTMQPEQINTMHEDTEVSKNNEYFDVYSCVCVMYNYFDSGYRRIPSK